MEGIKRLNLLKLWQSLPDKLRSQRTYIVPTQLGIYFGFLCLILLGVAFIHNNNVVYFASFMLISLGIVTMFQTNFNMDRIKISTLPTGEIHAETTTTIKVLIENRSTQPVYQIKIKLRNTEPQIELSTLGPKQKVEVDLIHIFKTRGYHWPPIVVAETRFPFGLLKSWKLFRPSTQVLVYPEKKGFLILPRVSSEGEEDLNFAEKNLTRGEDFIGHRPYQSNDSIRQIDWKAFARNQKMNIKVFENENHGTQLISWNSTSINEGIENRISQLALWVHICQQQKLNFILELPIWKSKSDHSSKHLEECFYQLAMYNLPDHLKKSL